MKTRTISLFLLLALSLALLAGCGGSSAPAEEEAQAAESEFLLRHDRLEGRRGERRQRYLRRPVHALFQRQRRVYHGH